ncbi:SDR family oxidoreductase [Caldimonas brevitalea]|uniref:NADH dehydrogenase n=1 Tax=Caldimonas brevitalea TaxID=413882 RepID=A0A0G3BKF8_9BURK|nr:SDR family oxidoreductase [Caldimonas brevitalea]AKJ27846.1 NADH dehydrogenase [Caldimonas brevitalea]
MIILLTGASGFIGSRICKALLEAGHHVVCAMRHPPESPAPGQPVRYFTADFERDVEVADWLPRLAGVDAVVNAAGILRETPGQRFETLHVRGPCALFAACAAAGVSRVVQISALGADEAATTGYHLSKKAADDYLLGLPLHSVAVVQPSLVYGPGGTSARLFTTLASLPLIPLPAGGRQQVQPIHVDDAVRAIVALVENPELRGKIPLVGPKPLALRDFLAAVRQGLGLGRARFVSIPASWVGLAARVGGRLPGALLDRDTWSMLQRGNTADAHLTQALLGREARGAEKFVDPAEVPTTRTAAKLAWLLPMLRVSVALVWIVTGIVSLGLYPVQDSYALLAGAGVPPSLQPLMLYGAAAFDLVLGVATLALPRRRWLWRAQIGLILFYTVVITFKLPEFWLHPYGPILKNLPMLAVIWLLLEMEDR